MPEELGDWNEWRRLVFSELERHEKELSTVKDSQNEMKVEIRTLVVRVGFFTAGAAIVGSTLSALAVGLIMWAISGG